MPPPRANTQMFALPAPPPQRLAVGGVDYRLERVFKHDFFAATCLYRAVGPAELPRVVVKFARTQPFWGLPTAWLGELLRRHEEGMYRALAGVAGVPRWAGRIDATSYAIEYIDAAPLDHLADLPAAVFDQLAAIFAAMHARGIAYGDANKRSNLLVDADGRAWVIDFQISLRRRDDWPRPLRWAVAAAVRRLQRGDLYHLYKHKRRMCPSALTAEEEALSRRRSLLHTLHRKLTDPYRALRRRFLRGQYRAGRLRSPTAGLEDHDQPEKATWRRR